jgi:hypothetical protein
MFGVSIKQKCYYMSNNRGGEGGISAVCLPKCLFVGGPKRLTAFHGKQIHLMRICPKHIVFDPFWE